METVLDLKALHPQITLECALPYAGMPEKFAFEDMYQRNEYMVDHAAYLIAVWTGIMTGTGQTVQYAKKQGRTVLRLNPDTLMNR